MTKQSCKLGTWLEHPHLCQKNIMATSQDLSLIQLIGKTAIPAAPWSHQYTTGAPSLLLGPQGILPPTGLPTPLLEAT